METKLFDLISDYRPQGDQPKVTQELVDGIQKGKKQQVLLGTAGTGKTFTIFNVIAKVNESTLVPARNKTLAGQLYSEFREFFPNNRVEYFVSSFDYYQPEAYISSSDAYIDKNTTTNMELDMPRMTTVSSILGRRDTIITASIAYIYDVGNPGQCREMFFSIHVGNIIDHKELMGKLAARQYTRSDMGLLKGTFRIRGDVIEVAPGHTNSFILRIEMFDDEIERICEVDPLVDKALNAYAVCMAYPTSGYAIKQKIINRAASTIEEELADRLQVLKNEGKLLEKQRLEQHARYDIEALREFGVCPGIENYSRHIDGRKPGRHPYTLFDYFSDNFLLVVDGSHVSLPQIRGMYNGDRAHKETLVNYGFRLPPAFDNRPIRFGEFGRMIGQAIFVSTTPGNYELEQTEGEVVGQTIRPTSLLDPVVTIHLTQGQTDDLVDEIRTRIEKNERTLVTTLTVRMAEDLAGYLEGMDFKVAWLHHEVRTIERTEVVRNLQKGKYDVLIGISLLREGLDIPEVSLITILDANREDSLRGERSLIQIISRATRNAHGQIIVHADKVTDSMQKALDETTRRREIQITCNEEHGITPETIIKPIHEVVRSKETQEMAAKYTGRKAKVSKKDKEKLLTNLEKKMREVARMLDFERTAELRDILLELKNS